MLDSVIYRLILSSLFQSLGSSRHPDECQDLLFSIECIYHKTTNAPEIIAYFYNFQRLM